MVDRPPTAGPANRKASLSGTAKQLVDIAGRWAKCSYPETREAQLSPVVTESAAS